VKGFAPPQHMPQRGFASSRLGLGYDPDAVDAFLAGLASDAAAAGLRVLPRTPVGRFEPGVARWRKGEEWRGVGDLPGERLRLTLSLSVWMSGAVRRITSSSGEVLLSRRRRRTITLANGQALRLDYSSPWRDELQLTDPLTGGPVLWIRGEHLPRRAGGLVLFPGQRYLKFPVSGARPGNAVMTAVTESGTTILWFRRTEVVVSPDCYLAPDVLSAIALAAPWLDSYFPRGSG
jgi:hypothetical protein